MYFASYLKKWPFLSNYCCEYKLIIFNLFYNLNFVCDVLMQVSSEEPVFEAAVKWVRHKPDERRKTLPRLLEHIRLPLMTPKYITDVVDAEVSTNLRSGMGKKTVLRGCSKVDVT